ncbi:MAG: DUF58 domain-containing protein [Gammaproteobacteria bacterium]|jgi:uncharacterized protein (DUF58 family)|nr:DUF58 domain-containing protein [Gammaproteobacteria bacterium]MDP6617025.1 DUF58 domain-containing protein [Gammaproteobacteria bacterium]MDP6695083.1 DUF58 domain-containing protein [Gammaproteobacteria bacterium]
MTARRWPWQTWSASLATRSREWALKRQGSDKHGTELHARRIYILPTRIGFVYATVVLVLLLGSMNYSNNMGFALTFLLTGIGIVCMHHCQRNLSGLRVNFLDSESDFAGQHVSFRLQLDNPGKQTRWQLRTGWDRLDGQFADLHEARCTTIGLSLKAARRGRLPMPRVAITSDFPLGLFRAWSWIHMDSSAIVWPAPSDQADAPPVTGTDDVSGHSIVDGGDELSGVREYRASDSPRRIDWKALARYGELLVREFRDGSCSECWLDWDALEQGDAEQRLSILTRLALDANANDRTFGLKLPDCTVAPGSGETHLNECLNRLALFGHVDADVAEEPG